MGEDLRPLHGTRPPAVPSDAHRELLRTSRDDRDELAGGTITEALILFARLGAAGTGWTFVGGASPDTCVVGTCIACFPTVWRRWIAE